MYMYVRGVEFLRAHQHAAPTHHPPRIQSQSLVPPTHDLRLPASTPRMILGNVGYYRAGSRCMLFTFATATHLSNTARRGRLSAVKNCTFQRSGLPCSELDLPLSRLRLGPRLSGKEIVTHPHTLLYSQECVISRESLQNVRFLKSRDPFFFFAPDFCEPTPFPAPHAPRLSSTMPTSTLPTAEQGRPPQVFPFGETFEKSIST